ncbi:hypothetical protein AA93_07035 [Xylella fastidiosa subsp. pauca 11399]|uniref:hypothetical protein n=1 Tax=Xylella fastidiosa TaxID=2371 RepID=UPI00080AE7B7|nr:hypothetical protein [Xylella fastidiosa]OCA57839.1 hypothetical protein AA93_07035 [Xylella fastidiosa subsp. pauca 11399]
MPTDKNRLLAKQLTSFGIPHAEIALLMQISAPTLRKHYRVELDTGHIQANAKVAKSLFWLSARAGWKDTQRVEVSGRDGEAIEQKVGLALVDEKQIAAIVQRLESEY